MDSNQDKTEQDETSSAGDSSTSKLGDSRENEQTSNEDDFAEFGPIKRPGSSPVESNSGMESSLNVGQPTVNQQGGKKTTIFLVVVLLLVVGGILLLFKNRNSTKAPSPIPTATPQVVPTEAPKPTLNRSEWSFEVLNGSGQTGLAKKISEKLTELGYLVIKVGNADNQNFTTSQILVKKELERTLDLVVADLKDIIKIASFGGELKDSTASARIILGKDSI